MKILRVLLVVSAVVMICGISGQAMLWLTSSGVKTAQYPNAFGLHFKGVREPTLYYLFGCSHGSGRSSRDPERLDELPRASARDGMTMDHLARKLTSRQGQLHPQQVPADVFWQRPFPIPI
jgi:hypothetical protein